jgi:hypothetical protein
MARQLVDLTKTVYEKNQYQKVIDTSFTQLVLPTALSPTASFLPSLDEFFGYYNELFFDIPKFGETNSHEYLVKTSEDYIGTTNIVNDEIQALIDEVTELRQENIELQQRLIQLPEGIDLPKIDIPKIEVFTPELPESPAPLSAISAAPPQTQTVDDAFLENLKGGRRAARIALEALEAKGIIYIGTRYR